MTSPRTVWRELRDTVSVACGICSILVILSLFVVTVAGPMERDAQPPKSEHQSP